MDSYTKSLEACKELFPFDYWVQDYNDGLGSYSPENARIIESVFSGLIQALIALGCSAKQTEKIGQFESAVARLNLINRETPGLIETMEREEFCELFDEIGRAAGIDVKEFGGGEGIATEWRDW